MNLFAWPLPWVVALFAAATAAIGIAGVRLTRLANRLADVTGLGEAVFGAVVLGGVTSLPGIVASVAAAAQGYPELAVSNAVGGIAAQTAFLALADMTYRRANLEHAAASIENLVYGALLATLLAVPLVAMGGPDVSVAGVHPASLAIIGFYALGLRLASRARAAPLWRPSRTAETRLDRPTPERGPLGRVGVGALWLRFAAVAGVVAAAGYTVAETGIAIAERTGLSETAVGGVLVAVSTSLPELVTAVSAVRQGALTLAVGDIIGGNSFDVLFLSFADVAYRGGSIYHAITDRQLFMIATTQIMTGVLLLGLLRREKAGIGNIGFESFLVLILYALAVATMFWF